jgi:hypothetical protein
MADVNLADLDPELAEKYRPFVDGCAAQGVTVRIIQGFREPAYQNQLQSTGVSPLTGSQSLHCCMMDGKPASKAFDFGVFEDDGTYVTDGNDPRYTVAGEVAEGLSLVWGGRFIHPAPDPDHVELPTGS